MFKFDNILICLDLTEMDESLINYANFVTETFKPKKITFIHVMDIYEIPEELSEAMDVSNKQLDKIIYEEIEEKVESTFKYKEKVNTEVVLESGITTEKIVQYATKNKTDLAIMGKKIGYMGKGSVARKVIGLFPSSVLLISETSTHSIEKIMVRTNFANPSFIAYKMAEEIKKYTKASTEFHHVYKLPYNYFPHQDIKAEKKLEKKLEPYINKKYNAFLKKFELDSNIPINFSIDLKGDEAQVMYNYAIKHRFDMVITGTRLKSKLANVIMDSTSEKLAGVEKNIPILIVKDAKKTVGFLKALFD